jgi:hypothetical protein
MEDVGIFTPILSILRPNGMFYCLVDFVVIWYIFPVLLHTYVTEQNMATLLCPYIGK